jgi:transposase
MAGWGGGLLAPEKIARVIESAGKTLGVQTTQVDRERVQWIAQEALRCLRQVQAHRKAVVKYGADCPDVQALGPALGCVTACVLHVEAGDPLEYRCGRAYQKALGLNLKERSSGKFKGEVKITKRGSGLARRWLYFTALRLIHSNGRVAEWYARKVVRDGGERRRAVVAVMRRVALGAQCCRRDGVAFDPDRLFGTGCGRLQEAVKGR